MTIDIAIKYITNKDGLRFFTQRWIPSNPKALIVLVHGLGDYSGRYTHVINHFAHGGYAVATYDQRCHGRSDGRRGDVARFGSLIEDLHSFVWETRHEVPQRTPVFIIAMDVGALVAINYAVNHVHEVDGLVAVSPAIRMKLDIPRWMNWFGRKLVRVFPTFSVRPEFDPNFLSRDQEAVEKYINDPFVFHHMSLRTCWNIIDATSVVMPLAFRLRQPLLMIHARGDAICDAEASQQFYDQMTGADKKMLLLDASVHDPFNDIERDSVFREVDKWLEQNIREAR